MTTTLTSHALRSRPREVSVLALRFLLALGLPSACGNATPDKPAAPAPSVPVIATGNGNEVAGYFGPPGGEIQLAADGPSIVIPRDDTRGSGIALGLKKDTQAADAGNKALGDAFRPTAMFDPPSNTFVDVLSLKLDVLPPACTEQNLELAVQVASQVGPADGVSSPALTWTYEKARWQGHRAKAQLPKISPYPMQFVCARAATGGTP